MSGENSASQEQPFHQRFLPLKTLAEGSYGQVILAIGLEQVEGAFKLLNYVAIKIFIHPELPELTNEQLAAQAGKNGASIDPVLHQQQIQAQDYQASFSHYHNEEVYMQKLSHSNIVRVHESVKNIEIVLPSHMKYSHANLKSEVSVQGPDELEMLQSFM